MAERAASGVHRTTRAWSERAQLLRGTLIVQAFGKAQYGRRSGGPPDLVAAVPEPTIESAQQVMNHPLVRILMIPGGPGVVEEARKTRKRSILAGPGNPPAVVDTTADIDLAGREIVRGASFDNNVICTDEKELIVVDTVSDIVLPAGQGTSNWTMG